MSGPAKDLERFLQVAAGDGTIDFDALLPTPDVFEEGTDWSDWRKRHWGTRSNAYRAETGAVKTRNGRSAVVMTFDTAWGPPKPLVLALSKGFTLLRFELAYFEASMCFQGLYDLKNGRPKSDWEGFYDGDRGVVEPNVLRHVASWARPEPGGRTAPAVPGADGGRARGP